MKMKFYNYLSREHIFIMERDKMKLTKETLKQIIKEELDTFLAEDTLEEEEVVEEAENDDRASWDRDDSYYDYTRDQLNNERPYQKKRDARHKEMQAKKNK